MYTFTREEVQFLKFINDARTEANAKAKNIRYSGTDDKMAGLIGLFGELALHKYGGVCPLRMCEVTPRNVHTDAEADCVLQGLPVDIKCTRKKGAPLWVQARKVRASSTPVYALAYCDIEAATCEIVGFVRREDAAQEKFLKEIPSQFNSGTMSVYVVPPEFLKPELTASELQPSDQSSCKNG